MWTQLRLFRMAVTLLMGLLTKDLHQLPCGRDPQPFRCYRSILAWESGFFVTPPTHTWTPDIFTVEKACPVLFRSSERKWIPSGKEHVGLQVGLSWEVHCWRIAAGFSATAFVSKKQSAYKWGEVGGRLGMDPHLVNTQTNCTGHAVFRTFLNCRPSYELHCFVLLFPFVENCQQNFSGMRDRDFQVEKQKCCKFACK